MQTDQTQETTQEVQSATIDQPQEIIREERNELVQTRLIPNEDQDVIVPTVATTLTLDNIINFVHNTLQKGSIGCHFLLGYKCMTECYDRASRVHRDILPIFKIVSGITTFLAWTTPSLKENGASKILNSPLTMLLNIVQPLFFSKLGYPDSVVDHLYDIYGAWHIIVGAKALLAYPHFSVIGLFKCILSLPQRIHISIEDAPN